MTCEQKQILSVSRRTDIPAFYMTWFMDRVNRGVVEVVNPFNRRVRQVIVSPQRIHSMVFWSKNYGPFLADGHGERLQAMGYNLFFNFTVNSRSPLLEPALPPLDQRLEQIRQLCRRFGSASIQWRFDPICHFTRCAGSTETNLADFKTIAALVGECGINTCISSFMDHYPKIKRRTGSHLTFREPSIAEKVKIIKNMEATLSALDIKLTLCCEKNVLAALPATAIATPAACIPGAQIMALHGGRISLRKDPGQRRSAGCGCTISVDVGSYQLHPCHHNCLYCYANPASDQRCRQ